MSDRLVGKKWALLDVESITTASSQCSICKVYILADNRFTDMEMEFCPCKRYKELASKYKQLFQFCRRNITVQATTHGSFHLAVLKHNRS